MAPPRRKFTRKSGYRDSQLIIIATEGTKTEVTYFKDISSKKYFNNPRIHVEVIKRDSTSSAPNHVIKDLDSFKKQYNLNVSDDLWMVIDFDRWGVEKISTIANLCNQKKYNLAVSNPCFELWLLLHITNFDEYDNDKVKLLYSNRNRDIEREIRRLLGSYNKSRINTSKYIPGLNNAIEQAKKLDTNPTDRWTQNIGTRVYLIVEKIIK